VGTYHSGRDRWSEPRCARGACRVCRRCSLFLSFWVGVCASSDFQRVFDVQSSLVSDWGEQSNTRRTCARYIFITIRWGGTLGTGEDPGSGDEVHFQRWLTKWNWMAAARRIRLLDWLCRQRKRKTQTFVESRIRVFRIIVFA